MCIRDRCTGERTPLPNGTKAPRFSRLRRSRLGAKAPLIHRSFPRTICEKYLCIVSVSFSAFPRPPSALGKEHPPHTPSHSAPNLDSLAFGTRDSAPSGLHIAWPYIYTSNWPLYNSPCSQRLRRFAFGASICTRTVSFFHRLHPL